MAEPTIPLKCARCLRPLTDDNIIISPEGEALHQRCWEEPRRVVSPASEPTHVCPICLQPIEPSDPVRGPADEAIHMQCDYLRPPSGPAV